MQLSDARPAAWALTAEVGLDEAVAAELRTWLQRQLAVSRNVVIRIRG